MSVTFALGFSAAGVAAGISSVEGKKDLALVVNNGPPRRGCRRVHLEPFLCRPGAVEPWVVADGHVKGRDSELRRCQRLHRRGRLRSSPSPPRKRSPVSSAPNRMMWLSAPPVSSVNCCRWTTMLAGAKSAHEALAATAEAGCRRLHAIMTTDTKPKTVELTGSNGWKIGGMVKGLGHDCPQPLPCCASSPPMRLSPPVRCRPHSLWLPNLSFNRIDVDGCMSITTHGPAARLRCLWHRTGQGRIQQAGA